MNVLVLFLAITVAAATSINIIVNAIGASYYLVPVTQPWGIYGILSKAPFVFELSGDYISFVDSNGVTNYGIFSLSLQDAVSFSKTPGVATLIVQNQIFGNFWGC